MEEIKRVEEIPCDMTLEDWFKKEGFEIESYLQNGKENHRLIIDKILISNDGCIESVPKTIYILDYKSKSFESADIDCSNNKSYEEIYYCYCKSITETFYKLKKLGTS